MFNLDTATVIAFIVSTVIPLVSSLLSKVSWPPEIAGILTLVLSTANGLLTQWADAGSGWDWKPAVVTAGISFGIAVAARYGLWKGTVTDAKLLAFPASLKRPVTPAQHAA